jgi:hypothetical protein
MVSDPEPVSNLFSERFWFQDEVWDMQIQRCQQNTNSGRRVTAPRDSEDTIYTVNGPREELRKGREYSPKT